MMEDVKSVEPLESGNQDGTKETGEICSNETLGTNKNGTNANKKKQKGQKKNKEGQDSSIGSNTGSVERNPAKGKGVMTSQDGQSLNARLSHQEGKYVQPQQTAIPSFPAYVGDNGQASCNTNPWEKFYPNTGGQWTNEFQPWDNSGPNVGGNNVQLGVSMSNIDPNLISLINDMILKVQIWHLRQNFNTKVDALASLAASLSLAKKDTMKVTVGTRRVLQPYDAIKEEVETEVTLAIHETQESSKELEDWRKLFINYLQTGQLPEE
ncbi:hypothetical protein ACH5RR_018068 [Cinchona calisaya]|uniref:Uncharacterized protein n=1 Tax=Cinchona calisaya TaxID=153742 RepID=A0ABD2ZLA7_9GENT